MADNTKMGIIGILVIVIVAAIFFTSNREFPSAGEAINTAGAATQAEFNENVCEPNRFCDGTKLTVVRDDCSLAFAYCKNGCRQGSCLS